MDTADTSKTEVAVLIWLTLCGGVTALIMGSVLAIESHGLLSVIFYAVGVFVLACVVILCGSYIKLCINEALDHPTHTYLKDVKRDYQSLDRHLRHPCDDTDD